VLFSCAFVHIHEAFVLDRLLPSAISSAVAVSRGACKYRSSLRHRLTYLNVSHTQF
jgi:hypothetical protein